MISDVRFHFPKVSDAPNLVAYVSFVIADTLVVRDAKLIRKRDGTRFVSMPSKKVRARCRQCQRPNTVDAMYCNWCGDEYTPPPAPVVGVDGVVERSLYADIVQPVSPAARRLVEDVIWSNYERELDRMASERRHEAIHRSDERGGAA